MVPGFMGLNGWVVGFGVAPPCRQAGTTHDARWFNGMV